MYSTMRAVPCWRTVVACIPLGFWVRDALGSPYRIRDASMVPTLLPGDIVWIRKADRGSMLDGLVFLITGGTRIEYDAPYNNTNNNSQPQEEEESARLLRYERMHGTTVDGQGPPRARWYSTPPLALNGHVVVYQSPEQAFPSQWCVQRAVGVGGQWLRLQRDASHISVSRDRIQSLPPYSLYVEGDNPSQSRDSRQLGPISKSLLVGIAEYVIWPPSRWQKIQRGPTLDERRRPRAFWP
jgi:signal peptidase I